MAGGLGIGLRMAAKKRSNKRGSIQDLIFIVVVLVFFGVTVLIGFKIGNEFNTQIQANSAIPAEAKAASTSLVANFPGVLDNVFLFFAIGLAMVSLILAALVRVHPIFVPLFIIAWVIVLFISGVASNIYQELAASPHLAAEAAQLTLISNVLEYLPLFIGVLGTLLMIVLYKIGGEAIQ